MSNKFGTEGSFRPTKAFAGCRISRPPDEANELFEEVMNYFKKRSTSQVSFEAMFNYLKSKKSPAWQYHIKDDRSRFRAFLKVCDPKFKFPDNSLIYITMRFLGPESMKNSTVERFIQIEDIRQRHKFEDVFKTYDIVYEYEALSLVASILIQLGENFGRVRISFVEEVLKRKFDMSPELEDLKQYMKLDEKHTFFKNRTYIFDYLDTFGILLRSIPYIEVVYRLNEFLRDLPSDVNTPRWAPLNSLIEFYLRSPRISDELRTSMNINSRDAFLNFLTEHPFVFDLKLEQDFCVTSNIVIPEFDWHKYSTMKICKDYDMMVDVVREEKGIKKPTTNKKTGYYRMKTGSDVSENEISVVYVHQSLPVVNSYLQREDPLENASPHCVPIMEPKYSDYTDEGFLLPQPPAKESAFTMIRNQPAAATSSSYSPPDKFPMAPIYYDAPPAAVTRNKVRPAIPKPSPTCTKPLLIRNFNPRMDSLKSTGPATTVRRSTPIFASNWDDQIESELNSCFIEDVI